MILYEKDVNFVFQKQTKLTKNMNIDCIMSAIDQDPGADQRT
jgi:hypothetical protein